jgi:hypothetical protein
MGMGAPRGPVGGPVVRGGGWGGGSRVVGAPFRGGYGYYRPFYRSYYRPFYGYGPRFSFGFYAGYPFYGYGYYGYPYYGYPYYAYPYYGYPYGYINGGYAYPAYGGYGYAEAYAGVRIEGALPTAEVLADGNVVGIADDFDGAGQRLELTPGTHTIEIRAPGMASMAYDVNVQPGRTVTLHVR